MNKIKLFFIIAILLMADDVLCGKQIKIENQDSKNSNSIIIQFNRADLQSAIDSAPPFSTIICDQNQQLVISKTVIIQKPITLKNLNAVLPDSLGNTSIIEVLSESVNITDFKLRGNANTVNQVVRDIVGRGCVRDVISIGGSHDEKSALVRNLLVENIRGYDSSLRGPVEVSDGSENITVRNIYAENCVYAVDWQDHNLKTEINRNVLVDSVYALNCRYAIRNANHDFGHSNLTLTNITAEKCEEPLKITNTLNVIIQNVRIIDPVGDKNPMVVKNCNGLTIRDISISNSNSDKEGILIENCDEVLVDGVSISENCKNLSSGITYSISKDKIFRNLRITNVSTPGVLKEGVILKKENGAILKDYIISGNIAKINDLIKGGNGLLINNMLSNESNWCQQFKQ